jgi:hypothetical protein
MEGGWRLRDRIAGLADKFLAYRLHDDPLAGDDLAALRDCLTDLPEIAAVTAWAGLGCGHDHTAARKIVRQRSARWSLAREGLHRDTGRVGSGDSHLGSQLILGGSGDDVFELQFELIEQPLVTLGRLAPFVLAGLGDAQLEIFDDGLGVGDLSLGDGGKRLGLKQFCAGDEDILALDNQQRFERVGIIGESLKRCVHRGSFYSRKRPFCRALSALKSSKTAPFSPQVRA